MKILHVAPSFFPATKWGGPIWSTKAICDGVHSLPDMTVRVLTTDAASPAPGDRAASVSLPYPVRRARRMMAHSVAPGLLARLPAAMAWADIVHLTATYSFPTLPVLALARAMGRPVVWSPRGALQATAGWRHSPHRSAKQCFERIAQAIRPANTVLHVTSALEATQSVQRLPGIETVLIPNCVDLPEMKGHARKDATLRLLYLGRLHPKKGLDALFDAMDRLPSNIVLDVYGSGDAGYVDMLECRARINGRIRLYGHVSGAAKTEAFAKADLFVLPSHSENFGIAVAEALAHAVPVLTTTGTPWQGLDVHGCGRCIDAIKADLASEIMALTCVDLRGMGLRGREWMRRDFAPQAMTRAFVQLYRGLVPHRADAVAP